VHGHAIEFAVERGQQPNDLDAGLLAQQMQRPRAVFAAAPGK